MIEQKEYTLIPVAGFVVPITLVLTGSGLHRVLFDTLENISKLPPYMDLSPTAAALSVHPAAMQFTEYFAGKRDAFDLPLDISGTPFQMRVWNILGTIPYAQTLSYKQVALLAGSPRAFRAVGSACSVNPLPIIIPCHRVLSSNGGLGGYSGGIEAKKALLKSESLRLGYFTNSIMA